jgi:hypothetical protein
MDTIQTKNKKDSEPTMMKINPLKFDCRYLENSEVIFENSEIKIVKNKFGFFMKNKKDEWFILDPSSISQYMPRISNIKEPAQKEFICG